jgi:hypothetical protein
MKRLTAILVAFVLGCASVPQLQRVERPEPVNEKWLILAPDLAAFVPEWHRQFEDALGDRVFLIAAHGTEWRGSWMYGLGNAEQARPVGHVDSLVSWVRMSVGKDVKVCLLICNPGGFVCSQPNVVQSTTSIWARPGDDVRKQPDGKWRHLAGGVDDFVLVNP